jgi:hypothetical protein
MQLLETGSLEIAIWTLIVIAAVVLAISSLMLYIVWKALKKENLLKDVWGDLKKIPVLNGELSKLSDKSEKLFERLVELGLTTAGSSSVRIALQHPLIIKLLKEAFPILPLVADLVFNHFKGNITKATRELLTAFPDQVGSIDLLVEDLDKEDYEEIKEKSLELIKESEKIIAEAVEVQKDKIISDAEKALNKLDKEEPINE